MSFIEKLISVMNLDNMLAKEPHTEYNHMPKYHCDFTWEQDSSQSIVTQDGLYDLKHFSQHEADTIKHVFNVAKNTYPSKYQAIGLANESYQIKYKARYVLFETIILLYGDSEKATDKFAVALAYETKGAFFRKQAIDYFENSEKYITPEFMSNFISYSPLHVYTMFASLYEREHDYEKAIHYTKLAKKYGTPNNSYYDVHINELYEKQARKPKRRKAKMPESQIQFEKDVVEAAKYFLKFFKE